MWAAAEPRKLGLCVDDAGTLRVSGRAEQITAPAQRRMRACRISRWSKNVDDACRLAFAISGSFLLHREVHALRNRVRPRQLAATARS